MVFICDEKEMWCCCIFRIRGVNKHMLYGRYGRCTLQATVNGLKLCIAYSVSRVVYIVWTRNVYYTFKFVTYLLIDRPNKLAKGGEFQSESVYQQCISRPSYPRRGLL